MVLNNVGVGFSNIENIKEIDKDIVIIKQIEDEETKEGIATLKKNMCNKATIEFIKEISKNNNLNN